MADPRESLEESRSRLRAYFDVPISEHQNRWSKLWDEGTFLPFDRGEPNPALIDILSDRQDLTGPCFVEDGHGGKRRKRALVPGCGKGYDVLLLASFGYDAYGLELSETAVDRAREEQQKNGHKYPTRDAAIGVGKVHFVTGDFFKEDWLKALGENERFEFIYDYTFLSAMLPSMRPSWSLAMSRLLVPGPTGSLICVEFPSAKPVSAGGPPYALPPKVYVAHLNHPGEEISYDEFGLVEGKVSKQASPGALRRVAHWQPERTHLVGKGTDWVSVWRHA